MNLALFLFLPFASGCCIVSTVTGEGVETFSPVETPAAECEGQWTDLSCTQFEEVNGKNQASLSDQSTLPPSITSDLPSVDPLPSDPLPATIADQPSPPVFPVPSDQPSPPVLDVPSEENEATPSSSGLRFRFADLSGCGSFRSCSACIGNSGCMWSPSGCTKSIMAPDVPQWCSPVSNQETAKVPCESIGVCTDCTATAGCVWYRGTCAFSRGTGCLDDPVCINYVWQCPSNMNPAIPRYQPGPLSAPVGNIYTPSTDRPPSYYGPIPGPAMAMYTPSSLSTQVSSSRTTFNSQLAVSDSTYSVYSDQTPLYQPPILTYITPGPAPHPFKPQPPSNFPQTSQQLNSQAVTALPTTKAQTPKTSAPSPSKETFPSRTDSPFQNPTFLVSYEPDAPEQVPPQPSTAQEPPSEIKEPPSTPQASNQAPNTNAQSGPLPAPSPNRERGIAQYLPSYQYEIPPSSLYQSRSQPRPPLYQAISTQNQSSSQDNQQPTQEQSPSQLYQKSSNQFSSSRTASSNQQTQVSNSQPYRPFQSQAPQAPQPQVTMPPYAQQGWDQSFARPQGQTMAWPPQIYAPNNQFQQFGRY